MSGEAVFQSKKKKLEDTIQKSSYLSGYYQAAVAQRKAEKEAEAAIREGRKPGEVPRLLPNGREDTRTTLFYNLSTMLNAPSILKTAQDLEEGPVSAFMDHLTELMELQWNYLVPSRENNGLSKVMAPEDYEKLLRGYEALHHDTLELFKELNEKYKDDPDRRVQINSLKQLRRNLELDYGNILQASKSKKQTTLAQGLYAVGGLEVVGSTDAENRLGGVQSSRNVITVVDADGNERTGLFTEKVELRPITNPNRARPVDKMGHYQLLLDPGVRMDNRNSAMSVVASLLGVPKLLAYSEDMRLDGVSTKANPTGEGTFMELAVGTDLNRMLPGNPYFDSPLPENGLFADSAKKDMLDLTIVDYLCCNLDRHGANITYQYAQGQDGVTRLTHIMGIDNDASFSAWTPSPGKAYNRLAALNDTVCISEEMAEALERLTPEMLRMGLARFGFKSAELTSMTDRLEQLKTGLRNGREMKKQLLRSPDDLREFLDDGLSYVRNHRNAPEAPCIVPVSGEEMTQLNIPNLAKNKHSELEGKTIAAGVMQNVTLKHSRKSRQNLRVIAYDNMDNNLQKLRGSEKLRIGVRTFRMMAQDAATSSADFIQDCKDRTTKIRGTSPEFERIVTTLGEIQSKARTLSADNYLASDKDLYHLQALHERLEKDCQTYLNRKEAERVSGKSHSGYAENRIDLAKTIKNYANTYIERFPKVMENEKDLINTDAAVAAQTIRKLIGTPDMKALFAYADTVKRNGPTPVPGELIAVLPDLNRELRQFKLDHGQNALYDSAIQVCAKHLLTAAANAEGAFAQEDLNVLEGLTTHSAPPKAEAAPAQKDNPAPVMHG